MEQTLRTSWNEEEWQDGAMDAGVSVSDMVEEVPSLTVAAIVGVAAIVLIAIAAVFLLGVLIDCRQQKLLEQKLGEVKRRKNHRNVNSSPEGDGVSIANNMEEPGLSLPPAQALRHIP